MTRERRRGLKSVFPRWHRKVSAARAKELLGEGCILIDVRSEKEWNSGHVEGAVHLPLSELATGLLKLSSDTPILTLCHTGIRSAIAARSLARDGYTVASVRGGMIAWNRAR